MTLGRDYIPKRQNKTGGVGYKDRWKPSPAGYTPVPIKLFQGKYEIPVTNEHGEEDILVRPYGLLVQHYSKRSNKYIRCSAGLQLYKERDGSIAIDIGKNNCLGCYRRLEHGGQGYMSTKMVYVFNLVSLAYYHRVMRPDSRGINRPFMEPCKKKNCIECDKGNEGLFGRRMYWEVGLGFMRQLLGHESTVLSGQCLCGGQITPAAFKCISCEKTYVNTEETEVNPDEITALRNKKTTCPSCKNYDYLKEEKNCSSCFDPRPYDLWNCVLQIYKTGENAQTSLQFFNVKPADEELLNRIDPLCQQIDIDSVFRNLTPEEQASYLGEDNPFQSENVQYSESWDKKNPF